MKNLNLDWLQAALIRAVRTMAQTALGMFTIGAAINEINWMHILSVAAVSAVYSLLTSLATTLPEVGTDGSLVIDKSGEKDIYRIEINNDLDKLDGKTHVSLRVVNDQNTTLSQ
jgi:hypothetical protein